MKKNFGIDVTDVVLGGPLQEEAVIDVTLKSSRVELGEVARFSLPRLRGHAAPGQLAECRAGHARVPPVAGALRGRGKRIVEGVKNNRTGWPTWRWRSFRRRQRQAQVRHRVHRSFVPAQVRRRGRGGPRSSRCSRDWAAACSKACLASEEDALQHSPVVRALLLMTLLTSLAWWPAWGAAERAVSFWSNERFLDVLLASTPG